jgi:hypothetical protein
MKNLTYNMLRLVQLYRLQHHPACPQSLQTRPKSSKTELDQPVTVTDDHTKGAAAATCSEKVADRTTWQKNSRKSWDPKMLSSLDGSSSNSGYVRT